MLTAPLDDQLCFALYSASMEVNRASKPILDRLGITYPQYLVLMALWSEDERPVGSLAVRLGLDPSTVTPLVKRLEASGFMTRQRSPEDERQVVVRLTPRGRAMREDCAAIGRNLMERSGVAPDRLAALRDEIAGLRDTLRGSTASTLE